MDFEWFVIHQGRLTAVTKVPLWRGRLIMGSYVFVPRVGKPLRYFCLQNPRSWVRRGQHDWARMRMSGRADGEPPGLPLSIPKNLKLLFWEKEIVYKKAQYSCHSWTSQKLLANAHTGNQGSRPSDYGHTWRTRTTKIQNRKECHQRRLSKGPQLRHRAGENVHSLQAHSVEHGLRLGAGGAPLTRAPGGRCHGDREPQSAQAPRVGTSDDPSPAARKPYSTD